MTPTHLATSILKANPTSWRGRRREAHRELVAFFARNRGPHLATRLPAWLTQELRRVPE